MNPISKRDRNARAKQYIIDHPNCSFEELVRDLGNKNLSKSYFFNMRGTLRKQGRISGFGKVDGQSVGAGKPNSILKEEKPASTKIEILHSVDASGLTQELRDHWKSHVLALLQRLIPGDKPLRIVFLADPPILELRREIQ